MSLAIDVNKITAVLLADGWHTVLDQSFDLDSYEFMYYPPGDSDGDGRVLHGGGSSGICATGFVFKTWKREGTGKRMMWGPLTAILSVETKLED